MSIDLLKARFKPGQYGEYFDKDYDDIVALHGEAVEKLELGSYQGDLLYIIRDPGTGLYGYIHTGYGSCSGCDILQNISSMLGRYSDQHEKGWQELLDLVEEVRPTVWRTDAEMLAWLRDHDWRGDYLAGEEPEIRTWIEDEVVPKLATPSP